uniref:Chemokine interleukin-8-like domain-containing protein n=1 Tax=Denticeps clupeoides TaxID=299321 RepID=A0AAY3ZY04_9TELE
MLSRSSKLFVSFLCSHISGSYEDCCLKYVKTVKPAIKRRVTQYRLQELDGGCNIPAVVFTLKYGRVMCADPKQPWVKSLVHNLDRKMVIDAALKAFEAGLSD